MAKFYTMTKDPLGRFRAVKPMTDPKLMAVNALIEGLTAGKASLAQARHEARQAVAAAKAQYRQETRTKLLAFVLFDLMAGLILFVMWAGING